MPSATDTMTADRNKMSNRTPGRVWSCIALFPPKTPAIFDSGHVIVGRRRRQVDLLQQSTSCQYSANARGTRSPSSPLRESQTSVVERVETRQRRTVSRVLCPVRGDGHFSRTPVTRRLKRPTRERGRATRALLFGLAPSGVCRADAVTRAAGELLPHRFTLTAPLAGAAVCFLLHFPWGHPPWALPSTLPCGARTFLSPRLVASDRPSFSGAHLVYPHHQRWPLAQALRCVDAGASARSIAGPERSSLVSTRWPLVTLSAQARMRDGSLTSHLRIPQCIPAKLTG